MSADLTHLYGLGSSSWASMKAMMSASSSVTDRCTPRWICFRVSSANQRSIWFSQLADGTSPNPDFANAVRAEALKRCLVLLTCGVYGNVIRFLAPLTIPDAVFSEALDILETSIDAVKKA